MSGLIILHLWVTRFEITEQVVQKPHILLQLINTMSKTSKKNHKNHEQKERANQ